MDEIISNKNTNILKWNSDAKFIITLLSWTLGLLNVFHTPQLFFSGFIYYITIYMPLVAIIGIPLTFMELGISQFSSASSVKSWDLCAIFKGIGYSKVTIALIFLVYYNVFNSYALFYVISSLSTSVKWTKCHRSWANKSCYDFHQYMPEKHGIGYQSSVEQFWYNRVLGITGASSYLEWPRWELVGYLCATMFIVFLANCKLARLLEKILLFTMILSSLEIITLLFVTTITPGSLKGFEYLFRKHFNIYTILPWKKGSILLSSFQDILYSMGLGMGGFSSLGAQSPFRKPIHAYAIMCNLVNVGVSILYGIILFNLYAILSYNKNVEINQIIPSETTFENLFTIVPGGIFYLPGPTQLWIFLFYSSIFLKGLSSSILMTSTVLQVVYECKPGLLKKSVICSFICSTIICINGSLLHTSLGVTISKFLNQVVHSTLLPLTNTTQILAVLYFYGLLNFKDDLQFMLGFKPSAYWQMGLVVSSFLIPALTIFSIIEFFDTPIFSKTDLIAILEKCVLSITLFWIPFMAMVMVIKKGIRKTLLQPSEDWGPHDNILKKSRKMFKDQNSTKEYIYEKNLLKNKLSKYENNSYK